MWLLLALLVPAVAAQAVENVSWGSLKANITDDSQDVTVTVRPATKHVAFSVIHTSDAFGAVGRNTQSALQPFTDPVPAGGEIDSIDVSATVTALFANVGAVVGTRVHLNAPAIVPINMWGTFGGQTVDHTWRYIGSPVGYVYGGTNELSVVSDYNPANVGAVTLVIHYSFPDDESDDPETKAECKKGGWADYGFKNQGQCVRFVATGKDSR